MYCQKCGAQNPDSGRFCRACGTDLGGTTAALAQTSAVVDDEEGPVTIEGAITKLGTGMAFLVISIILGVTGSGRGWWYWMLIPAFTLLASGIAHLVQLRRYEQAQRVVASGGVQLPGPPANAALPTPAADYPIVESRYKTGDLVPPSVVEGTTRHLEVDSEGKTMTLPKS
jgi:hypothetical protein